MKKLISVLISAALVFALAACGGQPGQPAENQPSAPSGDSADKSRRPEDISQPEQLAAPEYPEELAYDDFDGKSAAATGNALDSEFTASVENFSCATAAAVLEGTPENANFSPVSLYMALAMAASGAGGETEEQLLRLMGAEEKGGAWLTEQTSRMFRLLYTDNEYGFLKIAGSVWADDSCTLNGSFAESAAKNFYSSVYRTDLSSEQAAGQMGRWVSDNTGGTVSPGIRPDEDALLHLMNTVWVRDQWVTPFIADSNIYDSFHTGDGSLRCEFMCRTDGAASSLRGDNYLSAALNLKNLGRMVFILPDEGTSADDILSDEELLSQALSPKGNRFGEVMWQVPKFSFSSSFSMADTLKALGAQDAFTAGSADFAGISTDGLYISDVKQDTHIAINESGVETSAFTDIAMEGSAFGMDEPSRMILNRPFIFAMVSGSGIPLFIGVVRSPAAE